MATFGLETSWDAVASLGLPSFSHSFEPSELRRTVKVYAVPAAVSESRYFLAEMEGGAVEEAPPSLVRETILMVHFILPPEGDASLVFVHPEVQAAWPPPLSSR